MVGEERNKKSWAVVHSILGGFFSRHMYPDSGRSSQDLLWVR